MSSFRDAYYILRRLYRDERAARESIESLMGAHIEPVDLLATYGKEAMGSDEPDFEDGLIRACAEHESSYVIISSDERAFAGSAVPKLSAADFLQREGFDYEVIDW